MVNRYATPGGGAENHVVALARALRSRGHDVRTLSTVGRENVEHDGAFVPLSGTDFWRGSTPRRQQLEVAANALWNRRAAAAMRALIGRFRPDLVHTHDLYPQLSAAPVVAAAAAGVPVVQTLHNYELMSASPKDDRGGLIDRDELSLPARGLKTALLLVRRLLHIPHVTSWIAVSRYVAAAYARHRVESQVLPHFVPSLPGEPPSFGAREGVLFLGRLTAEKGARDAIGLAERLPGVPVVIAGRGPLTEEVEAACGRLSNLSYAGFLGGDAVARQVAAARVVVVPSRWQEPAGLVALEAMREGTPVVAYPSGGLAEYVGDAGAGRIVPPTAEALAGATADLYHDRDAWAELAAAGRAAVAGRHSPERYLPRLEAVYAGAVEAGAR